MAKYIIVEDDEVQQKFNKLTTARVYQKRWRKFRKGSKQTIYKKVE